MHGHGAAVVVDVVAALAVGEDLDALDEAGGVGRGWVPSVFLTRKAILIDSGSMKDVPLVSGMRQILEVVGEKELSKLGKYCTSCRTLFRSVLHVVQPYGSAPLFFSCQAAVGRTSWRTSLGGRAVPSGHLGKCAEQAQCRAGT